jgi:hypothetical protein
MKQLLIVLIMVCYGYSSIGATLNLHYCMNKFVGASMQHMHNERCGKCGMSSKKSKGCCKDETKLLKAHNDHQQLGKYTAHYSFVNIILPFVHNTYYYNCRLIPIQKPIPNSKAPSNIYSCKRYIKNCVFLI